MKKKLKHYIGWTMIRIDYYLFHSDVPWDIYVETSMEAFALREHRERTENKYAEWKGGELYGNEKKDENG